MGAVIELLQSSVTLLAEAGHVRESAKPLAPLVCWSALHGLAMLFVEGQLGFMGIDDITFVRAEGLAVSPEQRAASMQQALASIVPAMPLAA